MKYNIMGKNGDSFGEVNARTKAAAVEKMRANWSAEDIEKFGLEPVADEAERLKAYKNRVGYMMDYQAKTIRQFNLKLNRSTESDLIEFLEGKENIQGYLKDLIRRDM